MNGEVSDASAYMWAGGRESFIGAVSGAIFGPFDTLKTLGGKMLLGGVTNGFESMVRQTLDGQGINFTTTLYDVGIGAATAGMFHKAGELFKKASPWVKKGASKVNDAIENANNKFKNMSDNFSSRFGNKLAFEGIGGFNGNSPINNVKLKPTRTQIAYNEAIKETKEAAKKQMKKATSKGGSNLISKGKVKHILNRHTFDRVKSNLEYKIKAMPRVELEADIAERSFFNPSWSEEKVAEAAQEAYDAVIKQRGTTGNYSVEVFGEEINVYIENGKFGTAYGPHHFTLEDFGL